LKKLLC